jgi:hypothetical protein
MLAEALDLHLLVPDVGLLPSPYRFFLRYEIDDDGALSLSGPGFRFERGDVLRQRCHLVAEPFRFKIMGLQHNQFFEIWMHLHLSFHSGWSPKKLNFSGKLEVYHCSLSLLSKHAYNLLTLM